FEEINYRKIFNRVSIHNLEPNSKDIQLYFEDDVLKLSPIDFEDPILIARFDGTVVNKLGKGSKNKDKVIRSVLINKTFAKVLNDLKIQQIYDTFVCKYVEKQKSRNYWVLNGYEQEIGRASCRERV